MRQSDILTAFLDERTRQEKLIEEGRFAHTPADPELSDPDRFLILMEEIGEVSGAIVQESGLSADRTTANLKKELIQTGAVIVAWLEAID
jgi:NTP pyrophosphatase (non-canonical NTP hydrolase)